MKNFKNRWLVAGGCLFAIGQMANVALGLYSSPDNRMPSPKYSSTAPVTYGGQYTINSFFDVFVDVDRFAPPPLPPGGNEIHSFFDVFTEISIQGPGLNGVFDVPSQQQLRLNGLPPGEPWVWDVLKLDVLTGLPGGLMIRESPTLASTGQTTITGNGPYLIDSFFDVFTELSIDNGVLS